MLTHIPTPDQEQFRDVVRAWQQAKRDVIGARQRLKSFLLRNDIRYTGRVIWSAAHQRWLSEMVFTSSAQQIVFDELVDSISERERRRDRLECQIDTLAPQWSGYPKNLFWDRGDGIAVTVYHVAKFQSAQAGWAQLTRIGIR